MAISGSTDALVDLNANKYGWPAKDFAAATNETYKAASVTVTDATAHAAHVVIANMWGRLTIDYGDGTVTSAYGSAGALTPSNHTYASGGAKTVKVVGYGVSKSGSVTLA